MITYTLIEEEFISYNITYTSYGINVCEDLNGCGETSVVASIHDITTDKLKLSKLISSCNRLKLSVIHLSDIIEDFLSE